MLNNEAVNLVCEGVDTISKIYINNVLIGTTDNMFIKYKFNIKPLLKVGPNTIRIEFESAISYAKRKYDKHLLTKGYAVPPGN